MSFLYFLGWPFYMLERSTSLNAILNFLGFIISLLKGVHTQVNRQASITRINFAGFFGLFSTAKKNAKGISIDTTLKLIAKPNIYDEPKNTTHNNHINTSIKFTKSKFFTNIYTFKLQDISSLGLPFNYEQDTNRGRHIAHIRCKLPNQRPLIYTNSKYL